MGTILLADDEAVVEKLCRQVLERAGFRVFGVTDPQEALDLFQTYHDEIDLLVTDVVMPQISGPELADQLVALKPELRVLFISGVVPNAESVFAQLRHEFPFRFLRKPFSPALLVGMVNDMLGQEKAKASH